MRGEQTKHIRYGHAHASNTGMPCRFATGVALADNRWRASSSHDPFFRREAASRGANKAKVDPSFAPFGHSAMCFVRTYLCLGSNAPFHATITTKRSLIESHLWIFVLSMILAVHPVCPIDFSRHHSRHASHPRGDFGALENKCLQEINK
jgi:hypothetical protein